MDFKQNFHEVLLIIWLLCTEQGLSFMQDDDYFDEPSFNRCPWIRNKLKNGRVRYRYKGRVAKFLCDSGFELAGKRSSTCVRGQWSNPIPVCVARGCPRVNSISNGRITEMYRGALLMYDCNPGYMLDGNPTIHCDGRRWSSLPPLCVIATEKPETYCDFENPDLCGWSHDPNHDFDWQRNQFSTPSGHVGTGPAFDHTFGENKGGFYLYIEASSPRKINDTARLFSPVYSEDLSGGCFIFWYHMYGATTGGLRVYLKPESHVFDELKPNWEKYGDQGNQWLKGHMIVPVLHENFQIVIEGVRGESYVGDSAIDDVRLTSNLCDSDDNSTDIAETVDQYSCRGRCQESGSESSCGCNINCVDEPNFCCRDYYTICTAGNSTAVQNTDEPPPEVFTTLSAATLISTINTTHKNTENVSAISTQLETKVTEITENTYFNSSSPLTTKSILPNTENVTANSSQYITDASTENQPSRETTTSTKSTTLSEAFSSMSIKTQSPTTLTTGKTTQLPVVILNNTTSKKTTFETTTSSTAKITTTTPPTTVSITKQTTTSQTTPVNKASVTTTTSFSTSTTFLETTVQAITKPAFTEATITTISSKSSLANENFTSSSSLTTSTTEQTSLSTSTLSSTARSYNLRPRNRTSTPAYTTLLLTKTTTFTPRTLRTTDSSLSTSSRYLTSWYKYSVAPVSSQRVTSTSSTITSTLTSSQLTAKNTLISKVSTEVTSQTPKYSSRFTKPTKSSLPKSSDFYESKSETTSSNSSVPVVVSIIVVIVICIIAGLVYYMRKQRSKRQSKLSDDSEMRFLPDSDYMDYSDASALDKILVK